MPAAVQGSTATNMPSHIPQGGPFQKPPSNQATIQLGSATVLINGKPAARNADKAGWLRDRRYVLCRPWLSKSADQRHGDRRKGI